MKQAALTFHIDVVSAESVLYSGSAIQLFAPAEMGEVGILARHAPLLTRLKPGVVRVVAADEIEHSFLISGGFLEVQSHAVTLLTDTAVRTENLDVAAAKAAKEHAERDMRRRMSPSEYAKLKVELVQLLKIARELERVRGK